MAGDGSSPCIRGTRTAKEIKATVRRFIPVHTGNTPSIPANVSAISVHPRAYGEHRIFVNIFSLYYGSSPCIRGTLKCVRCGCQWTRFIPVHTGNTGSIWTFVSLNAVHPRAYGEHSTSFLQVPSDGGSSPCIRGTLTDKWGDVQDCRFIPVHTGNTNLILCVITAPPVHPRAYGEHSNHNRLNL